MLWNIFCLSFHVVVFPRNIYIGVLDMVWSGSFPCRSFLQEGLYFVEIISEEKY